MSPLIKASQKRQLAFLALFYVMLWALIPSLFLHGMYLDSSENIAWSTTFDLGNYKHPPLGDWLVKIALYIMPTSLSAILFLSAISIIASYYFIYKLGRMFMSHERVIFAILFTSSIYYLNVRSMQFNQNIVMLPFWSASIYYFYQSIQKNQTKYWLLLGLATGFAMLAKYESIIITLILAAYLLLNFQKRYLLNVLLSAFLALLVFSPNLYWLIIHDFLPLSYVDMRAGLAPSVINNWFALHILSPLKYIEEQSPLLLYPIFLAWILGKRDYHLPNSSHSRLHLLLAFGPFIAVLLLASIVGMKIPAEWSYPFFLYTTLSCVYYFKIDAPRIRFKITLYFIAFVHITIFIVYLLTMHFSHRVSTFNKPAAEIANISNLYWKQNLPNAPLKYVIGDNYFVGLIPGFEKEKPQALLNFSFKDSPYLNKETVKRSGALGLTSSCSDQVPETIQKTFLENTITPVKCFSAKTVNTFHPVDFQFGVYIIEPKTTPH